MYFIGLIKINCNSSWKTNKNETISLWSIVRFQIELLIKSRCYQPYCGNHCTYTTADFRGFLLHIKWDCNVNATWWSMKFCASVARYGRVTPNWRFEIWIGRLKSVLGRLCRLGGLHKICLGEFGKFFCKWIGLLCICLLLQDCNHNTPITATGNKKKKIEKNVNLR